MSKIGVQATGIQLPIIKEGDNLREIIVNTLSDWDIWDKDVIGITESIVARSQGNYVTIDEIATEIKYIFNKIHGLNTICVINPIYSRNRFSMILKAIARASKKVIIYMPTLDEVGNYSLVNPFTGVNISQYYKEIVEKEGKKCEIIFKNGMEDFPLMYPKNDGVLYCGLHDYEEVRNLFNQNDINGWTLADICCDKCSYGLLGSNKATEEKLKLFPKEKESQELVEGIKEDILKRYGKEVEVMIYGDGCFHSPSVFGEIGSSIWEFADPVVSPAYTSGLNGTPNEIKIKAFADDEFKDLKGEELNEAIKNKIKEKERNLKGQMASQGTTPRQYTSLLGSLMDLVSGSGDKGTPVVLVHNYFNNFAS